MGALILEMLDVRYNHKKSGIDHTEGKNMRVGLNLLSGCGTSVRRILVCQKKLYNYKKLSKKVTRWYFYNLSSHYGTFVRRIVVCWASVQSFKTERIEQVESLEIRVLTPFRFKPKNQRGSCFRMAAGCGWWLLDGFMYDTVIHPVPGHSLIIQHIVSPIVIRLLSLTLL